MYHIFKCLQWVININKKKTIFTLKDLPKEKLTHTQIHLKSRQWRRPADYNLLLTTMKRYEDDNRHR